MKKIIAHDDLDGVVSTVLLVKAMDVKKGIFSSGLKRETDIKIDKDTIIADLDFDSKCGMWFDHHISNKTNKKFKGKFALEKSCARVIFNYFNGDFSSYYKKLVEQIDKADSGDFSLQDVKDNIPLFQLNFFLFLHAFKSKEEKNLMLGRVLELVLLEIPIEKIIQDKKISKVIKKFNKLIEESLSFVKNKAVIKNNILVLDSFDKRRVFNHFLIYSLYPKTKYIVDIEKSGEKNKLGILISKNKFNDFLQKSNIGEVCKKYGGGGHKGIGGFRIDKKDKNKVIGKIVKELK